MNAEERTAMAQSYAAEMVDRKLVAAGVLAHNLHVASIMRAKLNLKPATLAPAPVAAPEAENPPQVAPPIVVITERARPDNLRERLGLR